MEKLVKPEDNSASRNACIDRMRIVCALLVVMIHCNPFAAGDPYVNLVFSVLTRIAVPFFAVTAGYYFVGNGMKWSQIGRLVKIYCILSVPYTVLFLYLNRMTFAGGRETAFAVIKNFLYNGSYFHLWYFPSIIISLTIIKLFAGKKKIYILLGISWVFYLIFVAGDVYYGLAIKWDLFRRFYNLPVYMDLRQTCLALTYTVMGAAVSLEIYKVFRARIANAAGLAVCTVLLYAEQLVTFSAHINNSVTFSVLLYPVMYMLFTLCLSGKNKIYTKKFVLTSNFIYYFHPVALIVFTKLWGGAIGITYIATCVSLIICADLFFRVKWKFIKYILG